MSFSNKLHAVGVKAQIIFDGEVVTVCGQQVAVIINRQPLSFEMQDAAYLAKEPIAIELLKGKTSSTDSIYIDGKSVPLDLRGTVPQNFQQATIDGVLRKIKSVDNCEDRWIITTIKLNV